MYRITYKNLKTGKRTTIDTRDQSDYEKALIAALILETAGILIVEDAGELKEINIKEE